MGLLGILRHQTLELRLGLLVLEIGRPGPREDRRKLRPGPRRRRYALFTLVGIASEDDLDAPDLPTPTNRTPGPETPKEHGNGQLNGLQHKSSLHDQRDAKQRVQAKPILGTEASGQLRDQLIAEVRELGSSDDAATWAHKILADKNNWSPKMPKSSRRPSKPGWRPLGSTAQTHPKRRNGTSRLQRPMNQMQLQRSRSAAGAPGRLIRACWRFLNLAACVTGITSGRLEAKTAETEKPLLFRANLVETGILFSRQLDKTLSLGTGPFIHPSNCSAS